MPRHNAQVIKLVTDRYRAHVRSFNRIYPPVSEDDSHDQYFLCKELETLATAAFTRAPEFKPSGNRMALMPSIDLGNAYRALRAALTLEESARYSEIQAALDVLQDKYEG